MKKVIWILLLVVTFTACKDEKKKDTPVVDTPEKEEVVKEPAKTYPKVEKKYSVDMNMIFDKGYLFDEKIQLEEIAVVPGEKANTYDLIMFFNDKITDYEALGKYKIGLILYPNDPSKLKSAKDKAAKKKKFGKPADVKMLDNEHVVVLDNIEVAPKDFKQIKLYLYDSSGVLNKNFLKLTNTVFP